jgi:hypothetical protein
MWPFKKRKPYITLGGQRTEIKPISLQTAVELILLMAPYWPILEDYTPRIEEALLAKNKPLLSEIFFVLREKMQDTPGDITKAVALLAGLDPVWLAKNGTAQEIVEALPVLDKAHDFRRLWRILRQGSVYLGN